MNKLKTVGRYLAWDDGRPFFYLGDTAWELLHRLSREDMALYFSTRAKQGFTAVQTVALAEFEGVTTPNLYGRLPFKFTDGLPDPLKPDQDSGYSYWAHVDYAVELAAKYGLFIALLPTWGDKINLCWGKGPVIFNEQNAERYGEWLARRYAHCWNIIWILGGDRPLEPEHRSIIRAMAAGIRRADPNHLISLHPTGCHTSLDCVGDADYLDFHAAQTGHGVEQCYASDDVMRCMAKASSKPYLDAEPRYEDHPACFDASIGYYWNADDVRQNAYWNALAGACGHTYGNHCIWSMTREPDNYFPFNWRDALEHPGAAQMGYLKQLRMARDYFSLEPANGLVRERFAGMGHMACARGRDYAYLYSPLGLPFTLAADGFDGARALRALWFDPRTGAQSVFAVLPAKGDMLIAPPSQGKGCDWVLVIEAII